MGESRIQFKIVTAGSRLMLQTFEKGTWKVARSYLLVDQVEKVKEQWRKDMAEIGAEEVT